jgi:branched-chain amino acid transport system permease protein
MKKFVTNNIIWIILSLLILIIPTVVNSTTFLQLATQIAIMIVFALSYNMLLGQCGLLSFGHAVLFGLPGFFTIHSMRFSNLDIINIPTPFLPMIGGISGLIIAYITSLFATKKAGATFALITVGINEVVVSSALMFYDFFGSETGIQATRKGFMGISFQSQLQVYYLVLIWSGVCTILMYFFNNTPLGKIANAVRDNPQRTSFIGYDPIKVRSRVLMLSGFFAGIAGGLYAITWEQLSYDNVSILQSALVLFMVYIGGASFFYGPIIGAIFVTFLIFYLSVFTEAWMLYLGLFFAIVVLLSSSGLAGVIDNFKQLRKAKQLGSSLKIHFLFIPPLILITLPFVTTVEILFRLTSKGYSTKSLNFFGLQLNGGNVWFWLILIFIEIAGCFGFKWAQNATKTKRGNSRIRLNVPSGN